jgi:dTMP kinase
MLGLRPDLTLVLDVSVETSLARLAMRGAAADRYERLGADFFARIRAGFLAVAKADPARCVLIDAEADEGAVAEAILATVTDRFAVTAPALAAAP